MSSLSLPEAVMLLVAAPFMLLQLAGTVGGILYLVRLIRERQEASHRGTGVAE